MPHVIKMTVTIPKSLKIKEETEFSVYKGIDDVIVLTPKLENPFKKKIDLRMTNDFEGVTLLDNE
ncbi:AbrB family transcriptional regulator [Streptococcus mutans]|uniref:type II toxin-antitoxin system PemI/MazE family antitoxin n=1 Tax=Streptococcus mutans TaxID=1309 RepID=UPI00145566BB|nr:AbrB family transcriptional regulator [Streptococcus mutans]MCB4953124.1 AbrB family transcriptional regulator [Streptococcus mutans]MCB5056717.1 AbrB family transcriptional regulator [Streptococcus mutans]MCB5096169.1 AbrB family transcriptional regulator [Streptococcus mutans]NLQ76941.1 AbrB family transcriptional regulator [Streptococcus mutans]